jgi:pimeloyl-ACP methyl ester carboxylesterase
MLREGSGEPLVLFHGILSSERVWRRVAPLLAEDHDVIVPTALGHHGGPRPENRPVSIEDVIDAGERVLDELGLEKAHLAGNSMGGWMSLELARRGRALSACAISPAGFWEEDWPERDRAFELLFTTIREARRGKRLVGPLSRSSRFRRWAMRDVAVRGHRVSREDFMAGSEDIVGCYVAEEMIGPGYSLAAFEEAPCPVTIAWAAEDRLFPLDVYRERAEGFVPGARFMVLEDCGHVPMYDDPRLIAETIRSTARSAAGSSRGGGASMPSQTG